MVEVVSRWWFITGQKGDFLTFRDGVAYFTPRRDYGYIRNSDTVMPMYLNIRNPYRPANQSEIESIRSFPIAWLN